MCSTLTSRTAAQGMSHWPDSGWLDSPKVHGRRRVRQPAVDMFCTQHPMTGTMPTRRAASTSAASEAMSLRHHRAQGAGHI
jgi:hypothetical protein